MVPSIWKELERSLPFSWIRAQRFKANDECVTLSELILAKFEIFLAFIELTYAGRRLDSESFFHAISGVFGVLG